MKGAKGAKGAKGSEGEQRGAKRILYYTIFASSDASKKNTSRITLIKMD